MKFSASPVLSQIDENTGSIFHTEFEVSRIGVPNNTYFS